LEALPQDVALAAAPPREIPALPSLDAAMEEALRTVPELREARAAVEVAEQQLDAAWSELYPTVGLTGTAGLRG
jgi:outer membrane protein TolC